MASNTSAVDIFVKLGSAASNSAMIVPLTAVLLPSTDHRRAFPGRFQSRLRVQTRSSTSWFSSRSQGLENPQNAAPSLALQNHTNSVNILELSRILMYGDNAIDSACPQANQIIVVMYTC
jgi:hypothetical protein